MREWQRGVRGGYITGMSQLPLQQLLMQGVRLQQQGQLAAAEQLYRQILAADPQNANALHLLGLIAYRCGRMDGAVELIRRAVALRPTVAEFQGNLGLALQGQGKLEEAATALRGALALKPNFAEAHSYLGNVLKSLGQTEQALIAHQRALQLKPDFAEGHNNLGNTLLALGRYDEAVASYRAALRLNPHYVQALNNMGAALRLSGQLEAAADALRQAIAGSPAFAEAHVNLGSVWMDLGRLDQASEAFQQALRLRGDLVGAHTNLGNAFKQKGRLDEALAEYREALRLAPDSAETHSNVVYLLQFHPGYDARAIFEETRRWDQQQGQRYAAFIRPHGNDRDPDRPLRIGYVASDWSSHPMGHNFLPLARHHDHGQFPITCYANVHHPDAMTQRIRSLADQWRDVVGVAPQFVAEQIHRDGIDILVDLAAHMAHNNLRVFACKPAPLQVTALCSMGTTGLRAMDYRLSDRYSDPVGIDDTCFTEKTIRLPDCYFCHEPPAEEPAVGPLPALLNDHITFGSLNNFTKVNAQVLTVWAEIMRALPNSRLILRCPEGSAQRRVWEFMAARGIAESRLEFVGQWLAKEAYSQVHNKMDLYLDPFPYGSHTTGLDALWMGVPLITLAGRRDVGRSGVFLMTQVGLPEFICQTTEEYVQTAIRMAGDLLQLSSIRRTLRQRVRESPLVDGARYTRHVEAAYRDMWRTWCATEPGR